MEKRATRKPNSCNRRTWPKLGPRELGFSDRSCLERKWAAGLRLPVRFEEHSELPAGGKCPVKMSVLVEAEQWAQWRNEPSCPPIFTATLARALRVPPAKRTEVHWLPVNKRCV